VPGHITFSSGWEWGYWLFDWSIARWSWQYSTDGIQQKRFPEMYAHEMLKAKEEKDFFSQSLQLQQQYLKDSSLIKWLTAMTIIDEMPIKAFNHEFQPRPQLSYKFLQRKADLSQLEKVRKEVIEPLTNFAQLTRKASNLYEDNPQHITDSILGELENGIQITALRANHRAAILQYILCRRAAKIKHEKCDCDSYLNNVVNIRTGAQKTVSYREQNYRYPVELIARKRWDHTAYHTGYLYTVSNLYFWHREEEEARRNKYSPFFMGIWNMWRIAGIIN
jgi:hypothetical protein